jgi:uncharacterized protein (TIGR03435 family)
MEVCVKTTHIVLLAGVLFSFQSKPLRAQPQAGTPVFEVASVKHADANSRSGVAGGCHGIDSHYGPSQTMPPPLGRCVITDARLSHLINLAWDLRSTQSIKAGPDWIALGDDRYNVEAKAEDPKTATEKQLLTMLQNLLADRFQLKFHFETNEGRGFAMLVGKNGPKFKESTAEEEKISFGGEIGKPIPGRPISLKARKYTTAMLAHVLSQVGHGPVIDKTGLTGEYDFTLSWDDNAGPELTTALQEQLGLRFETQKVPVTTFVVDSAKKPAEN